MDPRIIVFSGLLLLGILLSILFTIFFLWPRRGKCGADYVDFHAAFFASCWFLMLLFNNSIFGYVAYVSGLTWLLLVIVHQKFPMIGRDWMGVIINGWPSIVIALPLLIVLIIVGIILPIDILRFSIALLPGGFISYWLFNRAITIMPYIAYKK
jgi:hypothetical protein